MKLLEKIYPQPPMGGLEISDSAVRLVEYKKSKADLHVYHLSPGIVENGRVKNKAGLTELFKKLARELHNREKLGLVLTIASSNVFIQTVKLPPAASRNLEEAAELNIQMVSPLRAGEFYYSWQRVTKGEADGGPIELLAAFVSREIVDDFRECLRQAGFDLVAVEFVSQSLVRELAEKKVIQPERPYLIAHITPEGTTFILTLGEQIIFHSFHSLKSEAEGMVVVADFMAALHEEINNISNFYSTHRGGVINDLIFVSEILGQEIQATFKEKSVLVLPPSEAMPARGAAKRFLSQAYEAASKEINLLGTSTEQLYKEKRALAFLSFWRTVLVSTLGFLLALSLGADLFLRDLGEKEMRASAFTLNEPGHRELAVLKDKAAEFNQMVSLIRGAKQGTPEIGRIAGVINNLAGVEITIGRLYISPLDASVTVTGTAVSDEAATAFKNRLAKEESFTSVDLPISGIAPAAGNRVSFTIYLQIANP